MAQQGIHLAPRRNRASDRQASSLRARRTHGNLLLVIVEGALGRRRPVRTNRRSARRSPANHRLRTNFLGRNLIPSQRPKMCKVELSRQPSFSRMFLSHVLTRSARVEEDLVDQLFNSTEKRLAPLLRLLASFGKEGRQEPVAAKITQELLAEMIGTTRSRVSHFMNKFRQAGFISYNGHIEVHSSLLSVVLTDPERRVNLPV